MHLTCSTFSSTCTTNSTSKIAILLVVADTYIRFAHGEGPWAPCRPEVQWGIFTPDYSVEVRTELQDDEVRKYSRWDKIEIKGLMGALMRACE